MNNKAFASNNLSRSASRRSWAHHVFRAGLPLLTIFITCSSGRADQVVLENANYIGAEIVDFKEGSVRFREATGGYRKIPVTEIKSIIVDRARGFDDFNHAERFLLQGDSVKAVVRYKRSMRMAKGFWKPLIAVRLIIACDRAGRTDAAAAALIEIVKDPASQPAAGLLIPRNIPKLANSRFAEAVRLLSVAMRDSPAPTQNMPLAMYRYELFRRTGDRRETESAIEISSREIPTYLRTDRIYSIVLAALMKRRSAGTESELIPDISRAIRDCPMNKLPDFLLLKGRVLLATAETRDELIRASWPFLRVAIHSSKDSRAAIGLQGAAEVLEQMEEYAKAKALLNECLNHEKVNSETATTARASLDRLKNRNTADS